MRNSKLSLTVMTLALFGVTAHISAADSSGAKPGKSESDRPFLSELTTVWGEQVTDGNVWTEYPRPQLRRPTWINLNGLWDYAVTSGDDSEPPSDMAGKLRVPFCLESSLGGAQQLLKPDESLWYRRSFEASPHAESRLLLHFEAVDYQCEVWFNGIRVGEHTGGSTPFSFDITDAARAGVNEILVRVEDATSGYQLRGKQILETEGVWYTRVSGIWQTVWLEQTPATYLSDLTITTDAARGQIQVVPTVEGPAQDSRVVVRALDKGELAGEVSGSGESVTLTIDKPKLWSSSSPHLYDLEVSLVGPGGKVIDCVQSYAGIRSVGKVRDANGHLRFTLNGEPVFHFGVLDQGWWPDGLLTPPSDEAMRYDIEWLKSAGFNMIRKHIKVEPRRYYYHCDRIGMLVWQDQPSGGDPPTWPKWSRLKPGPIEGAWPDEAHQQYLRELEEMVDALESHPSIVSWVPFNERWGQHRSLDVGRWIAKRDPTRLINVASGGNFWPVGDIVDAHNYPHPTFPFEQGAGGRFDEYIKVVGEFGGHGFPVRDHLWDPERHNWGYGGLPKDKHEYRQRYITSIEKLLELQAAGVAGAVYTQTTDVEGEINGLLTYDRRKTKIPAEELAEINSRLFESRPLAPTVSN